MKMKVFSCVLLAVLAASALAVGATSGTYNSYVYLTCQYDVQVNGDLYFTGTTAGVAGTTGKVYCDSRLHFTLHTNCDIKITITADENFVGQNDPSHTMNAAWHMCLSDDDSTWYGVDFTAVPPTSHLITDWDSWTVIEGSYPAYVFYVTQADTNNGVGYAMLKVSVDRSGWADPADTYKATMTYVVVAGTAP
jgi:hypothetical protein